MSKPIPIVFIHIGYSPYLPYTLGLAKLRNMESQCILIGDKNNNKLPFVTHTDMGHYGRQASEFQKCYHHLSPNGYPYELFCFIRWFLLRDFMRTHSFDAALHVDSDVMLYVDVNKERELWTDWELTLVNEGQCAGNMFINGLKGLEDLCDLLWTTYTAPDRIEKLTAIYEDRRKHKTGISDMVFLQRLYDANRHRVGDMTGIQPDDSYWDANVHMDEGFEMQDQRKRIRFENYFPFCRHMASGKEIRFKSLHFQGGRGKPHIEPTFRLSVPPALNKQAA